MRKHSYYFYIALLLSFCTGLSARPFDEVVTAMISVIPENNAGFKKELEDILARYRKISSRLHRFDPPEAYTDLKNKSYDRVTALLSKYFPNPKKLVDWQSELIGIYQDKIDYHQYLEDPPIEGHKKTCTIL